MLLINGTFDIKLLNILIPLLTSQDSVKKPIVVNINVTTKSPTPGKYGLCTAQGRESHGNKSQKNQKTASV